MGLIRGIGEMFAGIAHRGGVTRPASAYVPPVPTGDVLELARRYLRGGGDLPVRRLGDIRDAVEWAECIRQSPECERRGDTVMGVFLDVPVQFIGAVEAGQVGNMLRNEFEWWKARGMAREATPAELGSDEQWEARIGSLRANLRRVRTALCVSSCCVTASAA